MSTTSTDHRLKYYFTRSFTVKLEDGAQHKNLRVFSASTGEELISFSQKSQENWDLQYTMSESHAIRLVAQEIQVYRPADWGKGIVDKLRVEGASMVSLSPGLNPSIAVFVAEKKVFIHSSSSKTYFPHFALRVPLQVSRFMGCRHSPVHPHALKHFTRLIVPRSSGTI